MPNKSGKYVKASARATVSIPSAGHDRATRSSSLIPFPFSPLLLTPTTAPHPGG